MARVSKDAYMTVMTTQRPPGVVPSWTPADRARKARDHAGLSQQELAELAGISRRSVVNYETGTTIPRRPQYLAIALATGVSAAWLAGDEPAGHVA